MFDSPGLLPLDRLECLRLLTTQEVGRVVFTSHALPAIQPVRFRLHLGALYFMVGPHGPLAASHDDVVAFEVDSFQPDLREGWCVTVVGRAAQVRDEGLMRDLAALPVLGWGLGDNRYMRIDPEVTAGRRL